MRDSWVGKLLNCHGCISCRTLQLFAICKKQWNETLLLSSTSTPITQRAGLSLLLCKIPHQTDLLAGPLTRLDEFNGWRSNFDLSHPHGQTKIFAYRYLYITVMLYTVCFLNDLHAQNLKITSLVTVKLHYLYQACTGTIPGTGNSKSTAVCYGTCTRFVPTGGTVL